MYGVAAYGWWGLVALYFKAVSTVPSFEVLSHRIIWSVGLLALLMRWYGRWPAAVRALRERRTLLTLLATTGLIAINWLTFIYAVASGHTLQASLGYFINPLVNVLLGVIFLGERLRPWQIGSVTLAGAGVAYLTLAYGQFPGIALVLAFSFGFYGLLRKTVRADSLTGLTIETTLLLPLSLGYVLWLGIQGGGSFGTVSRSLDLLLILAGVITFVPLLWFAAAARRLTLSTLGFLQYIAPTGQLLLAVAVFGERFTAAHAVCFACIWTALVIYTIDAVSRVRRNAWLPRRSA